jgi:hypothetical protein
LTIKLGLRKLLNVYCLKNQEQKKVTDEVMIRLNV